MTELCDTPIIPKAMLAYCDLSLLLSAGVGGGTLEFASLPPGTSEGTVLVLSVSEQSCKVDLTGQLKGHAAPISDVVANTKANQLVTADNEGTIILWQDPPATAEPTFTISDSRYNRGSSDLLPWDSFSHSAYVHYHLPLLAIWCTVVLLAHALIS